MKKGFTLIELLVVVLIIGILSAIALPQYTTAVEKARSAEAVTLMSNLRYAAERYRLQTGSFPGADMTVLDIEMPSTAAVTASSGVKTKNFDITATGTTTYIITAKRNTGTAYNLYTAVDASGNAIRCCGSTAPTTATACGAASSGEVLTLCKAITSGNDSNGKW